MLRSKIGQKRKKLPSTGVQLTVMSVLNDNVSIYSACKEFGIVKTTLARHVQKAKTEKRESNDPDKYQFNYMPKLDHKKIFTVDEERALVKYAIELSKLHYSIGLTEFRKRIYQFAVAKQKKIPENWTEHEKAGKQYLLSLRSRYP